MMLYIEMMLPNYVVFINKNNCTINDKKIKISDEDIDNIIRIIRYWDNIYQSDILDGREYFISIRSNHEIMYRFRNKFPSDFNLLINYLGGLYDRK